MSLDDATVNRPCQKRESLLTQSSKATFYSLCASVKLLFPQVAQLGIHYFNEK